MLLFFVVSAFGTVMAGIFAPSALPLLGEVTAPSVVNWGQVRVARVTSNIRSSATTSAPIVGQLTAGDSVRVEAVPGGWYEVFEVPLVRKSEAKPLGYVFGSLLETPSGVAVASEPAVAPARGRAPASTEDPPAEEETSTRKSNGRGS